MGRDGRPHSVARHGPISRRPILAASLPRSASSTTRALAEQMILGTRRRAHRSMRQHRSTTTMGFRQRLCRRARRCEIGCEVCFDVGARTVVDDLVGRVGQERCDLVAGAPFTATTTSAAGPDSSRSLSVPRVSLGMRRQKLGDDRARDRGPRCSVGRTGARNAMPSGGATTVIVPPRTSAREGEMLGRAVVAPDLEPPVSTLLQHRSSDVLGLPSRPTRQASRSHGRHPPSRRTSRRPG